MKVISQEQFKLFSNKNFHKTQKYFSLIFDNINTYKYLQDISPITKALQLR